MPNFSDDELRECLPALRRFALYLTRNGAEADDLVQDTLERAIARSASFTPGSNLRAWLFTICRNHFLSGRRKLAAAGEHVSIDDAAVDVPVAPTHDDRLMLRDLMRCFASLSPLDREVLGTIAVGGMRYDEAARRMKVEIGTVKSRVSRARARLSAALDGDTALAAPA